MLRKKGIGQMVWLKMHVRKKKWLRKSTLT